MFLTPMELAGTAKQQSSRGYRVRTQKSNDQIFARTLRRRRAASASSVLRRSTAACLDCNASSFCTCTRAKEVHQVCNNTLPCKNCLSQRRASILERVKASFFSIIYEAASMQRWYACLQAG